MEATINELLVLKGTLTQRRSEIQTLIRQCVRRTVNEYKYETETRVTTDESRYDPDDLEVINSELQMAIYNIDLAIKVAKAKTVTTVDVDVQKLLEPIKPKPWKDIEE